MELLKLLKWEESFFSSSDWLLYWSPMSLMLEFIIFYDFETFSSVEVKSSFNFYRIVRVLGKLQ